MGNGMPVDFVGRDLVRTSDSFNVSNLNAGAGVKIFISGDIALRVEYRFQRYYQSVQSTWNYDVKDITTSHKVLFGISVFL